MKQNQRDLIELVRQYLYDDPSVPSMVYVRRSSGIGADQMSRVVVIDALTEFFNHADYYEEEGGA